MQDTKQYLDLRKSRLEQELESSRSQRNDSVFSFVGKGLARAALTSSPYVLAAGISYWMFSSDMQYGGQSEKIKAILEWSTLSAAMGLSLRFFTNSVHKDICEKLELNVMENARMVFFYDEQVKHYKKELKKLL